MLSNVSAVLSPEWMTWNSILLIPVSIYFFLLLHYTLHWKKLPLPPPLPKKPVTRVSVIVPVRNEENNMDQCLTSMVQQRYPSALLEVIVADDHSEDATASRGAEFMKVNSGGISWKLMPVQGSGKKSAVAEAVKEAAGELIVTTDADCHAGPEWIASIVALYEKEHPKMIVAPVLIEKGNTFIEKFQALEMLGLMTVTGGAIGAGRPLMCNGANLAYRKEAFEEAEDKVNSKERASGEDVFLMFAINRMFPHELIFLKSREAAVHTSPEKTWTGFMHQRRRWASKISAYTDRYVQLVAFTIGLVHLIIAGSLIACLAGFLPGYVLFLQLLLKLSVDYMLISVSASFFKRIQLLFLFLPAQLAEIPYVLVAGLFSLRGSYFWKGRRVR